MIRSRNYVLLLVICILTCITVRAEELPVVPRSSQQFAVNGQLVEIDALFDDAIGSSIQLADFAKALDIDISFSRSEGHIWLDKTKTFSGVRVLDPDSLAKNIVIGRYASTAANQTYMWNEYITDYGKPALAVAPYFTFNSIEFGSSVCLNVEGRNYHPAVYLAQHLDIDLSYDVSTGIISFDKRLQYINYHVVDADGNRVSPAYSDIVGASYSGGSFYTGSRKTLKEGYMAEARRESFPYGDVYRTTKYAASEDFSVRDFMFGSDGVHVFVNEEDTGNQEFWKALGAVISSGDVGAGVKTIDGLGDTPDVRVKQHTLFRVYVNGAPADGRLFYYRGADDPETFSVGTYYFIFDEEDKPIKAETIRLELGLKASVS